MSNVACAIKTRKRAERRSNPIALFSLIDKAKERENTKDSCRLATKQKSQMVINTRNKHQKPSHNRGIGVKYRALTENRAEEPTDRTARENRTKMKRQKNQLDLGLEGIWALVLVLKGFGS